MMIKSLIDISSHKSLTEYENSICFFPTFTNLEDLSEQYYRCLWYLPDILAYKIILPVDSKLATQLSLEKELLCPEYMEIIQGNRNHILVCYLDKIDQYQEILTTATYIAVWKNGDSIDFYEQDNIHILDKNYPSFFQEAWGSTVFIREFIDTNTLDSYRLRSKNLLIKRAETLENFSKAYIFATGPSLTQASDFDFSDGVRIVCNTIVSNKDILEHIHPHFIVAGDAAFHYGCSKFAKQFREDLIWAIDRFDALLVLPEIFTPLMLAHYPQTKNHIIALPDVDSDKFNFSILSNFYTRRVHNIMNQIMLPLASSLANEIFIIGADGRRPDETRLWWHNDPASYYEHLLHTVKACHPSYFEYMDWDWYYSHHCDIVEQLLEYGESLGKQYVSLTPSFIPAFHKRELYTEEEDEKNSTAQVSIL